LFTKMDIIIMLALTAMAVIVLTLVFTWPA
jgi:hypothetical protein